MSRSGSAAGTTRDSASATLPAKARSSSGLKPAKRQPAGIEPIDHVPGSDLSPRQHAARPDCRIYRSTGSETWSRRCHFRFARATTEAATTLNSRELIETHNVAFVTMDMLRYYVAESAMDRGPTPTFKVTTLRWLLGETTHSRQDHLRRSPSLLRELPFDSHLPPRGVALQSRATTLCIACSDHGTAYGENGSDGHRLSHPTVWDVSYAEFVLPASRA